MIKDTRWKGRVLRQSDGRIVGWSDSHFDWLLVAGSAPVHPSTRLPVYPSIRLRD